MKHTKLSFIFVLFSLCAVASFAKSSRLAIKNVFGGDLDSLGDYDLYSHSQETDVNDETVTADTFALGDRFQLDYESDMVTTRFRMELLYHNISGDTTTANEDEIPNFVFAPSGFVYFTPVNPFGIIVGTNYYKQFAIPSGYLAAADDTTKYGRLLTGVYDDDQYCGSDDAGVYYSGFSGGITSNYYFGSEEQGYLKLAAGSALYPTSSDFEYSLDFGLNGGIENAFDLGFTAHNIADDNRKFGAFAGLTAVDNFIFNAGFYYNFTSSDYLPESRVTRSDEDEFKKQKTKYALGFSTGYNFKKIGFGIYGDFITGLTNEYIGEIKYYDSDGNLIDTDTTTIIRGGTCVKYKNGKAKRTDEFTHEAIPYYLQLRLSYDATENLAFAFNFKLRSMWNNGSESWITLYPRATVTLPSNAGEIAAGLRFDMNLARYEGLSDFSIPLTYTYKFKKKF